MYRLFVLSAVLSILPACASNVAEPTTLQGRNAPAALAAQTATADPTAAAATSSPAGEPVVVEIEDFRFRTVCKDVTKPGTRIVIGQSCYSPNENDTNGARQRDQVEAVMREQAEITRAARERDLVHQQPVLSIPRR